MSFALNDDDLDAFLYGREEEGKEEKVMQEGEEEESDSVRLIVTVDAIRISRLC
jgi:hypothetical protein